MPSNEDIVAAVWSTVINGATAQDILEAWWDYVNRTGGSFPFPIMRRRHRR